MVGMGQRVVGRLGEERLKVAVLGWNGSRCCSVMRMFLFLWVEA